MHCRLRSTNYYVFPLEIMEGKLLAREETAPHIDNYQNAAGVKGCLFIRD